MSTAVSTRGSSIQVGPPLHRHSQPQARRGRPVYVTAEGLGRLQAQHDVLTFSLRPELAERVHDAREHGDSAENGELAAASEELTVVAGLVARIEQLLADSVVIDTLPSSDEVVSVGARVRLRTIAGVEDFRLVGWLESDPAAGLISNESPLGEVLLGLHAGDQVVWTSPDGINSATVTSVAW